MSGGRSTIYDKIDGLDADVRSAADLAARLKPILNELAYYAATGDGAVMEAREEWHGEFTDRLYAVAAAEHAASGAPPPKSARPPESRAKPKKGRDVEAEAAEAAARVNGRNRQPVAPPSNRPRPDHLPPSLRAIMDGSHPSFREDDER